MSRELRSGAYRMIDAAGFYSDVPDVVYHSDPVVHGSLSSTEIRNLLKAPAIFRHKRDHGRAETHDMTRGKAIHKLTLGVGPEIVVLVDPKGEPYGDYKSSKCRKMRNDLIKTGALPLLAKELAMAEAMAEAIRDHPEIGRVFTRQGGQAEVTAVAQEPETGVWLRAKFDYLPPWDIRAARIILPDLKSAESAHPEAISNSIVRWGYWVQGAVYLLVLYLLDHGAGPLEDGFVLVVQEKDPPYLVTLAEVGPEWLKPGIDAVLTACHTYLRCSREGRWPGYSEEIVHPRPPVWWSRQHGGEIPL